LSGTDNAHLATTDIRSDLKVTGDLGIGNSPAMSAEIHVSQSNPLIIIEETSDHFLTLGVSNTGDTTQIGFHTDKKLEIGPLSDPNTPNMPDPAMTIHNNGAVTIGEYHTNPTADDARPLNFETSDISGELYVMGNDTLGSSSALIAVIGRHQGDGVLYAGQDSSYGGGILYKGSDSVTNEVGNCVTDRVSLYRTNDGVAHPVISWGYASSTANCHHNLNVASNLNVTGTKNFLIPHPDPKLNATHKLKHSCIEGPTEGDNIYRWQIEVAGNSHSIVLPDYYKFLNKNDMVWISPVDHFGIGHGKVNKKQTSLDIKTNENGLYNVLLIGTRKDKAAVAGYQGEVIANEDLENE